MRAAIARPYLKRNTSEDWDLIGDEVDSYLHETQVLKTLACLASWWTASF
jgi:hypothetical protein